MISFLMNKPNRILMSCLLILALVVNLCPMGLAHAEDGMSAVERQLTALKPIKDIQGHWAENQIQDWVNQQLIQGYQDGTFHPDETITRVEFVALVNRLFKFTTQGNTSFSDVQPKDWYATLVSAATNAGYIQGYENGTFHPQQPLNRSEAAIIISRLVPVLTKTEFDALNGYSDRSTVPAYSRAAFNGTIDSGYFTGFPDQTLRPNKSITRAEAVVLLDRILQKSHTEAGQALAVAPKVLDQAGSYGPAEGVTTVAGDVTLNAPGISLQNLIIRGNLIIGEPVGEGDVNLQNIKVLGRTTIKGGGQNSIHIDNSELNTIVIDKVGGRVRVVIGGTTIVEQMDIQSDATVESNDSQGIAGITISSTGEVTLSGKFKYVELQANVHLTLTSGSIEEVQVSKEVTASTITLSSGVHVTQMGLHGGASVEGAGLIDNALIDSTAVKFQTLPAHVEVSKDVNWSPTPSQGSGTTTPVTPPVSVLAPQAPTAVNAVAGDGQATVTFTPPSNNGGSAITGYTVTAAPGGKTQTGLGSPLIVTGLTNGTAYTFTVTATNAAGTSAASAASSSVTPTSAPATVPGAPTSIIAVAGDGQATVTFTPPSDIGGSAITGYTVTSTPDGKTQTGLGSPLIVTGLTNGTAYTFTVTATNAAGTSAASAASSPVTPTNAPAAVPGAPTSIVAVGGDGQATVTFVPPSDNGGSAITGYTVTSTPDGKTQTGLGSPLTVIGLTNGTAYTFTVTATNAAGTSEPSLPSASVTPAAIAGAPEAPTDVHAEAGDGAATITFNPPIHDGGSPITGYTVTSTPGGITAAGTTSPLLVTGLTNGTAYTFTVTATNEAGSSAASAPSDAITPTSSTHVITATISDPAVSGFSLHLDAGLAGLDSLSLILKNSEGTPVGIDMVTSLPDNTYKVWTALQEGETYTLSLVEEGYSFKGNVQFKVPVIDKSVIPVQVNWVSHDGFRLTFAENVNHLFANQIILRDGQGNRVVIPSVSEKLAGQSYLIQSGLSGDQTYTFQIQLSPDQTASGNFYAANTIPVTSQPDQITKTGLTVKLSVPLPDLTSDDVVLKDDQSQVIPINAFTTIDQGSSYVLEAALSIGVDYSLSLTEAGYDVSSTTFSVPITIQTTVALWGTTGVYAGFNPRVSGIDASNFKITDAAGADVPITSFEWYAGQQFYIIGFTKIGLQNYTVTITKPGYNFGEPKVVRPVRFNYIEKVSATGFTLTMSPNMIYNTATEFTLTDSTGQVIPITSVTMNDEGASYDFKAALTSGGYTLSLASEPDTVIPTIWMPIITQLQVDHLTKSTFTVHLNPAVNGVTNYNFSLTDAEGQVQYPDSVTTADNGQSYEVVMGGGGLASGTYNLKVQGMLPGSTATYHSGLGTEIVVPDMVDATGAIISDVTPDGFSIQFKQAVPGLAAANIKLTDSSDAALSNVTLATSDGGITYRVAAALARGKDYKVVLTKSFYVFDAYNSFHVSVQTVASVQNVTTNGFRLSFSPTIPGLNAANVIVKNDQVVEMYEALTSSDGGESYLADFGNLDLLGLGKTYTVTLNKPGYTAEPITFTTPSIVTVTARSATQLTIHMEPAINGLKAANFKLVNEAGEPVAISSVETMDGGANYTIKAAMPSGNSYWISYMPSVNYQSYEPIEVIVKKTITATVTSPSLHGFTLHFSEPVAGLRSKDLSILSSSGVALTSFTLTTSDQGSTYQVAYTLYFPDTYTVNLSSDPYGVAQQKFALAAPVSFDIPIPGVVHFISVNNEEILLSINPDLDLTAANIGLKNSAGEDVPFTLHKVSASIYKLVSSVTTPITYFMTLTYPGYDFGPAITIAREINADTFLYNQTQKGFTIGLSPAIPDLAAEDVIIHDEDGQIIAVSGLVTTDFGKNYRISAPLTGGKTYSVTLVKTNYTFQAIPDISLVANGAIINNVSSQGFRLNLFKNHTFGAVNVRVLNEAGELESIQGIYSPDGGLSYEVEMALKTDTAYTVQVENLGINYASPGNDYGADKTFRLSAVAASFEGMYNDSGNKVVIKLEPALPDLTDANFHLLTPAGEIPLLDVTTEDGGHTYVLTSAFRAGNTYSLLLRKDGYDFGAKLQLHVPFGVLQAIVNIGARAVDMAMNPAVPDLTDANFVIKDQQGNLLPATSAVTSDGGATYTVTANFTGGQTYTFSAVLAGYDFGADSSAFIPSEIVPAVIASRAGGLTVSLSPAVAGLTADNFTLREGGAAVAVHEVTTTDGGATYSVAADLVEGHTYQLSTALSGFVFAPAASNLLVDIQAEQSIRAVSSSGLTLQLNPAIPGLAITDLVLLDEQGQPVAISAMPTTDSGATYRIHASLTESKRYSLTVSKNGYRIATGSSFIVPIPVTKTVDRVSEQGFTLHLGAAVKGLVAGDIYITDSEGAPLAATSVTTGDGGNSYQVAAKLKAGSTYTVEILPAGYDFGQAVTLNVQATIALSVSGITATDFILSFSRAVPHFNGAYVTILDDAGVTHTFTDPNSVWDTSGAQFTGYNFQVKFALQTGHTYTLAVNDAGHPFGDPIEVIKAIMVTPKVTNPVKNSFTLSFGQGTVDLTAADVSLTNEYGDKLDDVAVRIDEESGTYQIQAGLAEGSTYTLHLSKKGYDFGPEISFLVPVKVKVSVTNQDINGFTVTLTPGIENVAISLLRNGQAVSIQSASTTDGGYTYQVKTDLGVNTDYVLVLKKAGYDFGTQLTVSNVATLPVLLHAVTNTSGSQIMLTLDKPLSQVPNTGLFSVKVNNSWLHGIVAALGTDPTQIVLTLDSYSLIGPSDNASVTFVGKNTVKAVNGTYLAAFNDAPVLVGATAIGFATSQANYEGYPTAVKLRDGFKLGKLDAAKVMRDAGFRTNNYGSAIARAYQLNPEQLAQLFYDMGADALTALAAQNALISPAILKNLVSVGYDASEYISALRALGYQSGNIASALKSAGVSNTDITRILLNNLMDPASRTVTTLRSIGVTVTDCVTLLNSVYGLSQQDAIQALRAAGISAANAASALTDVQGANGNATAATTVLYTAGYTVQEIGPVIAANYSLGNAALLLQVLKKAGFNENQMYAAAGQAFSHRDVAMAMLNAGTIFGSLVSAVQAEGDSDGANTIAFAFKQKGLGISELGNALQANGYSVREAFTGTLAAGYGLTDLAKILNGVYNLDLPAAHAMLTDAFRYSYIDLNTTATIFQAMVQAGYDPTELTKYYLLHVRSGNKLFVIRELKNAGIGTNEALRIVHDIALAAGEPLTLDTAFELFQAGAGYFTSDEVLAAVLYAFADDASVTLDVQSVGLAFYKIRLWTWQTGFYERAMQLRNRMGMTMQQWMLLEKSDGRVSGPGIPQPWMIIRDTLMLFGSKTVTIQDVVNAMSTSSAFTLDEVISGVTGYLNSNDAAGVLTLLKGTSYSMPTLLAALETKYGNNWVFNFRKSGITASDVAVYYKSKGLSDADIVTKLSPYELNEVALALRTDLGKNASEAALLLATLSSSVTAISEAIGYVYREAERDVAVKLLKLQGYKASQTIGYLEGHGIAEVNLTVRYLMTAGYSKDEITQAVIQRYSGVLEMPAAVNALKSVYGQEQVRVGDLLVGASITTPEEALEFLATHSYKLKDMVYALKTVYLKTPGETTSLINKRFAPYEFTLNDILNTVSLVYSTTEDSALLELLTAMGVNTPAAAIVSLRQSKYDLTVTVRILKNGYGLDAAQAADALLQDHVYTASAIGLAISAVYKANDEIGATAKLLIDAGVTDSRTAVSYLAQKYSGMKLTARVLNEIYHENIIAAVDLMSLVSRYAKADILVAVQEAYGTDPLYGYLARMKLQGADANQIAYEMDRQNRIGNADFLASTLLNLGYDQVSVMKEVLLRYKRSLTYEQIAQLFVRAGFKDPTSIAKLLLTDYMYNPNDGTAPAYFAIHALPDATLGSIALGMKRAGFTSEAVISGMLAFGFDDTVASQLKELGFSSVRAAEILNKARYSTTDQVKWLKKLGYPLSEFFSSLGNPKVAILKGQGYSAVEIAQGLYRDNVSAYFIIQALDQGGFTDLPALVNAYYLSGEPVIWVIHDIYEYGTQGSYHRWPLIDVTKQLLLNTPISLNRLIDLVNYADKNDFNQTFKIVKDVSSREQQEFKNSLSTVERLVVEEHIPNLVALTAMRSSGIDAEKGAAMLKSAGGVSDWKKATLILFFAGYSTGDILNAVFNNYRTEIGLEILVALFNSGASDLIANYKLYYNLTKVVVKVVSYGVNN